MQTRPSVTPPPPPQVGVREYVKGLENAVIGALEEVGVEGFTTENTGVWVQHPSKGESKIGSIGQYHTPP